MEELRKQIADRAFRAAYSQGRQLHWSDMMTAISKETTAYFDDIHTPRHQREELIQAAIEELERTPLSKFTKHYENALLGSTMDLLADLFISAAICLRSADASEQWKAAARFIKDKDKNDNMYQAVSDCAFRLVRKSLGDDPYLIATFKHVLNLKLTYNDLKNTESHEQRNHTSES